MYSSHQNNEIHPKTSAELAGADSYDPYLRLTGERRGPRGPTREIPVLVDGERTRVAVCFQLSCSFESLACAVLINKCWNYNLGQITGDMVVIVKPSSCLVRSHREVFSSSCELVTNIKHETVVFNFFLH